MRIACTIPYPEIKITVFEMNQKYVIKMEAGPMEQTFKIGMDEVQGINGVEKLLDSVFMEKALQRFSEMFLELKAAKSRYFI